MWATSSCGSAVSGAAENWSRKALLPNGASYVVLCVARDIVVSSVGAAPKVVVGSIAIAVVLCNASFLKRRFDIFQGVADRSQLHGWAVPSISS